MTDQDSTLESLRNARERMSRMVAGLDAVMTELLRLGYKSIATEIHAALLNLEIQLEYLEERLRNNEK